MLVKEKKTNASCIICGKGYHLCIACDRNKNNWQPWKIVADSENCYNIYDIVNRYAFGHISKEEAAKLLEDVDLTELKTFKESAQKQIEEIRRNVKTVEVAETEAVENIEEVIEVAEKKFSKRASKKTEE